jgi:hypothetical protein
MHTLRTMRTPRAIRTRTAPNAARSRPMLVCCGGGVWTSSPIRRRATPETGLPLVVMFMVARGTKGATWTKRPRAAIHTRTHRSAPLLPRASVTRELCTRQEGRRAHTSRVALGFVSPAHTQMLFTLPEVVELPTSIVPNCTPYSLLFARRLHVIWVTTVELPCARM